jgi:two-component system chemotaxis response regulator CheY
MGMKFLVVDDMASMVKIIESLLRQLGFRNIETASNGQEALTKLKTTPYDFLLSDWNMQPMNGFELLKAVRADAAINKIPVILITAESKVENIVAAKQAGVNNYIVKPFNAATLKDKLMTVLGPF